MRLTRPALLAALAGCGGAATHTTDHPAAAGLHGTLLVEQWTSGREPPQLAAFDLATGAVRQLDARGDFTVHAVAPGRVILTEAPNAFLVTATSATPVHSIEQVSPDGKRAFGQCEDGSFCIGAIDGDHLADARPVDTHEGDVLLPLAWIGDRVIATDFDKLVAIDTATYRLHDLGALPELAHVALSPSGALAAWPDGARVAISKLDDLAAARRLEIGLVPDLSECVFAGEQHLSCVSKQRALVVDVASGRALDLGPSGAGGAPVPSPDATAVVFAQPGDVLVVSPIDRAAPRPVAKLRGAMPIAWLP